MDLEDDDLDRINDEVKLYGIKEEETSIAESSPSTRPHLSGPPLSAYTCEAFKAFYADHLKQQGRTPRSMPIEGTPTISSTSWFSSTAMPKSRGSKRRAEATRINPLTGETTSASSASTGEPRF